VGIITLIDMLVLRCSFLDQAGFSIAKARIPLEASVSPTGETFDLRHSWEKIPSSLSSLAFKVFDFRASSLDEFGEAFIEIKASPAKLMQGHNLYGSDNLKECGLFLIQLLAETYPHCFNLLDQSSWDVASLDITYFSRLEDKRQVNQFIDALQSVSSGQTRARTGYSGTAYFGKKNSRLKSIKVYCKESEVEHFLKTASSSQKEVHTEELLAFSLGMVRWEATIKHRWLERRGINTKFIHFIKNFNPQELWREATKDLFKALEGKEMRIVKDDKIKEQLRDQFPTINARSGKITFGKSDAIYRTYRMIKSEGFKEAALNMSSTTFYRHVSALLEIGLSKIYLQNLNGDGLSCEVLPFVRFLEVKFDSQYPDLSQVA
jgi:II/X family phage/plasmid replication protein